MLDIMTTTYKNEKIKTSFDLTNTKDLNTEELIDNINKSFVKKTIEEIIKPTVFIPNEFELVENEGMFIDVYYNMENVKYPNEYTKQLDKEYLTDDGEIGKNLFFIEMEDGVLNIEFTSLVILTEEDEITSIWEYKDGVILKMFKELLSSII